VHAPVGPTVKRRLRFPHPLTLLTGFILFAAALSYIIPAGRYERRDDPVTGRSVVVPGTYAEVDASPVGLFDAVVAIPRGMLDAGDVVFLVFLIGGAFAVFDATGALRRGIGWLIRRAYRGDFNRHYFGAVDSVGLYWHIVDIIWIFLFPLMYLIR